MTFSRKYIVTFSQPVIHGSKILLDHEIVDKLHEWYSLIVIVVLVLEKQSQQSS